ncbi:condensation domain-containing protein, partial [Mycobacterium kansasii]
PKPAQPPLTTRPRPPQIPLSFAQQQMWCVDQLEGPSALYNIPLALRLSGGLDVQALSHALDDVVGRHEPLRTVFVSVDGIPQQVVLPPARADLGWQIVDATQWSTEKLDQALSRHARDPFDLSIQIPLRARLYRVADDEHILAITIHHIAADGWSMATFAADLAVAYRSRCARRAPAWASLPVQYIDYALWQHEYLGDLADPTSIIASQLRYWEETLAGMPERLELPTDRPYPPATVGNGGTVALHWPPSLHQDIARLAHESRATAFMVVHAALVALLSKLSASTDIPVAINVAGRTHPALDDLIGVFVNRLVLRVEVAEDATFTDLLGVVRARSLQAFDHQDIPFRVLTERLNHHGSPSTALGQVMLGWQTNRPAEWMLGDLDVTAVHLQTNVARMDLALFLEENFTASGAPAGISGVVEYRTDVYDAATIEALTARLKNLLSAVVVAPQQRVSSIDLCHES